MRARQTLLDAHARAVGRALANVCRTASPAPLVKYIDESGGLALRIATAADQQTLEVVTDLGVSETVLGLAIPSESERRYWIGIHEAWKWATKREVTFLDCGVRVYYGQSAEDAVQFLRLEWTAPDVLPDGQLEFKGGHAAHPHWHVDSSALAGEAEYYRFLEEATADLPLVEEFSSETTSPTQRRAERGFPWLKKVHLAAQAGWMSSPWATLGQQGPHQHPPADVVSLTQWWSGALLYIDAELRTHGQ